MQKKLLPLWYTRSTNATIEGRKKFDVRIKINLVIADKTELKLQIQLRGGRPSIAAATTSPLFGKSSSDFSYTEIDYLSDELWFSKENDHARYLSTSLIMLLS